MNEDRVLRLLGTPELRPLVDRVAQRMRRGRPLVGAVSLTVPPAQRAAVSALVGRPFVAAATTSVRLEEVDRVVRESGAAPDLAAAITVLRGRIPVTAEEEARDLAAWEAAFAPLDAFAAQHPEYGAYPLLLRRTGGLKAIGRTPEQSAALLTDLAAVLAALPTTGETMAAFAARVLHRAHAFDIGPLRALADGALVQRFGDVEGDPDASREERHVAN